MSVAEDQFQRIIKVANSLQVRVKVLSMHICVYKLCNGTYVDNLAIPSISNYVYLKMLIEHIYTYYVCIGYSK